jgi:hypothetical protein
VAPALRSTTIAISEDQAPVRDTIDRTCMTGESDKNPATPGTTGYLLFALTDQLETPVRRWRGFFPMFFAALAAYDSCARKSYQMEIL